MEKCQDCGIERQWLHTHHIIPRSKGGSEVASNKVRICANCHEDRHEGPCGGTERGRLSATPEARAKKSRTLKKLWKTAAYRKKVLAAREATKHLRDYGANARAISAAWTPEMKAAHSAKLKMLRATQPERWASANHAASDRMQKLWDSDPQGTLCMLRK